MYYFFCIKKNMRLACAHWSHTKTPKTVSFRGCIVKKDFVSLLPPESFNGFNHLAFHSG